MKLINIFINTLKEFWQWLGLLFISKEKKEFARKALDARYKKQELDQDNRDYFRHKLPRRTGFKKAPSFTKQFNDNMESVRLAILRKENNGRPNKPKKKPSISREAHEAKELAEAKRTFFFNLITERAKKIQAPFIKEKRAAKQRRKNSKTFQIA